MLASLTSSSLLLVLTLLHLGRTIRISHLRLLSANTSPLQTQVNTLGSVDVAPFYPGGRWGASMITLPRHGLFLYGGVLPGHEKAAGDIWRYDPSSLEWSFIEPVGLAGATNQHHVGFVGRISQVPRYPGSRRSHSRSSFGDDSFVVFGGAGEDCSTPSADWQWLMDVWSFNVRLMEWTYLSPQACTKSEIVDILPSAISPGSRMGAVIWIMNKTIVVENLTETRSYLNVFGGYQRGNSWPSGPIHRLDITSPEISTSSLWITVDTNNTDPNLGSPLYWELFQTLYVFGTDMYWGTTVSMWRFSYDEEQWEWVFTHSNDAVYRSREGDGFPGYRANSVVDTIETQTTSLLLLFGGQTTSGSPNDGTLWFFDVAKEEWFWHPLSTTNFSTDPVQGDETIWARSYAAGTIYASQSEKTLFVFGGRGFGTKWICSDFWSLRLECPGVTTEFCRSNEHGCYFSCGSQPLGLCGHGTCVQPDECSCDDDWGGDWCLLPQCDGMVSSAPEVCGGHGICRVRGCECNANWGSFDAFCLTTSCFGVVSNSTGEVCGGKGSCIGKDECACETGFSGRDCSSSDSVFIVAAVGATVGCVLCVVVAVVFVTSCYIIRSRNPEEEKWVKLQDDFGVSLLMQEEGDQHLPVSAAVNEIPFETIKILRMLCAGGSGAGVYFGEYEGREVAVKSYLLTGLSSDEAERFVRSFALEIEILSRLNHPNVIQLWGISIRLPQVALILEYCHNEDVVKFVKERKAKAPRVSVSVELKCSILTQVISAMTYVHSMKVIHRDLKCKNVLIDKELNTRVTDFQLSSVSSNLNHSMSKGLGTADFVAPEVIRGEVYDCSCDVFSFGILAWELLTENFQPYEGVVAIQYKVASDPSFRPNLQDLKTTVEIPHEVAKWCSRCWSHSPEDRPTFAELLALYRSLQDEQQKQ